VESYLSLVGKYSHLDEEQIGHMQATTDHHIELLMGFTRKAGEEAADDDAR